MFSLKSHRQTCNRPQYKPCLEALEERTLFNTAPFLFTPVPPETPLAMHIHVYVTIIIDGQKQVIPAGIGIEEPQGDLPIHTHDTTGKIHIESPITRTFHLSDFFAIWGQPLGNHDVLGYHTGAGDLVTMTVNGQPSTAFGSLALRDQQQVVITAGGGAWEGKGPKSVANRAFVAHVYEQAFHRAPNEKLLAGWGRLLDAGLVSRTIVAQAIRRSAG
jgi:hypothetical protein